MKVFKYLFISSIMFAVTSCGNDWLDLAPSTMKCFLCLWKG